MSELRLKSWAMLHDVSAWIVSERFRQLNASLAKYSPDQPRVPAGDPAGGQWTSGGGGGMAIEEFPQPKPIGVVLNAVANSGTNDAESRRYPDAIEPSYPLETLAAILSGGEIIAAAGEALGLAEAVVMGEEAATIGAAARGLTEHGAVRTAQRQISSAEAREAQRTAIENGTVSTQTGKYGTPQYLYKGSNGVTVIVETSGRNAGKVIIVYRH